MRKVLLLAGLFILATLPACAGSSGADQGQVGELKKENAELRKELGEAKDENEELEEDLASAEAQAAAKSSASASASGSASASASAQAGAPVPDKSCAIGKACDLGKASVTVTSARETKAINTSLDNFQGSFVLVEFEYTFGGAQPVTLDESPWLLEDVSGQVYTPNFDVTSAYELDRDRALIYEEVQPGVPNPGAVVFEVAPDSSRFTLYIGDIAYPQTSQVASIDL
jgi:hypothetical protein